MTVQLRLWIGFGLTLFFLVAIACLGHFESQRVRLAERWVTHTLSVLAILEGLSSDLRGAETGQRGFLLTSEEKYLAPYNAALIKIPRTVSQLGNEISDNPAQVDRLDQMTSLIDGKLAELNETIVLHRSGRDQDAMAVVKSSRGSDLMSEIDDLTKAMRAEEYALLAERKSEQANVSRSSSRLVYAGTAITVIMVGFIAYLTSESISRDYSRLKATEKSLSIANSELQSFVYRTSHDFKSPLLGIRSMAGFIEDDLKQGDLEEALENMKRINVNVDAALEVVGSTLQLVNVDLSNLRLERIELGALVDKILVRLSGFAEGNRVAFDVAGGIRGVSLVADPSHLETVIGNLISNAIKYSDAGRERPFVKIDARVMPGLSIEIIVADNGVGIPAEYHSQVFSMFKQFHPDRAHGTGLGLYIVQKSVERLGGELSFESSAAGSCFTVQLPDSSDELLPVVSKSN